MNGEASALAPLLAEIANDAPRYYGQGRVNTSIPKLAAVDPNQFAIAVATLDGDVATAGSANVPFSIQSISKVFSLCLALSYVGEDLWDRVGRNPSGMRFNSLTRVELEKGRPANPFVNPGALVVADCLVERAATPIHTFVGYLRKFAKSARIGIDYDVARSELSMAFRNFAAASLLKDYGNLHGDPNGIVYAYTHFCAATMSCVELARAALPLANEGRDPATGQELLPPGRSRRINALMLTCGLYDAAGDFAYRVGLPAKSGVGGAIVAVVPNRMAISVWSPELDELGNSVAGFAALERLAREADLSVF
ncbi:glutaminase [Amorphus orientalis]|uniref:Glutaminase n=1 Tax=Amorphus orientalis TaxID=649198 RepID=A0AAE4AT81_9HYPH|nr:glutaminase [Amorphus orientalis]MDQ0314744.1 glutaminase [Amorphus orientalis]